MFSQFLIKLAIIILLIYFLRRILGSIFGGAPKTSPKSGPADPSTQMVKDPVCGMYMDSRLAVSLENRNGIFYFCSEGCKTKFLDAASGPEAGSTASR
jgi:YHS domain-containing protein